MDRRTFLRQAGLAGGALVAGGVLGACSDDDGASAPPSSTTTRPPKSTTRQPEVSAYHPTGPTIVPADSILNGPASSSPIDHVVVMMMENRSFDHWLGWLSTDDAWLEAGKRAYGEFAIAGYLGQRYVDTAGKGVITDHMSTVLADGNPWRGCGHPDPGHGWVSGRAQRDGGFLAEGSGNDIFALGYYLGDDLPFTSQLARRFSVCDHHFSSVLGPTYPNREYLHSAQSGGNKSNDFATSGDGFAWDTIWERLAAAGVDARYFYSDLPVTALWGSRLGGITSSVDDYFSRCEDGTLPAVSFVDPGFLEETRTDNHPHGDIRSGEAFVRDVFAAFARSPHWESGLFVLTYDEWGGFFDHAALPHFQDDRASDDDAEDFGQAGFRVPTVVASPFAQPGSLDHRLYDHTSVLRFLEWRFLGAPPEGPGTESDTWFLTQRDRHALNLGATLVTTPTKDLDIDLDVDIAAASAPCRGPVAEGAAWTADPHSFEIALHQGHFERMGYAPRPTTMAGQWRF
ncbi:MAG TPA: alkaline phosphatase family protein [Acidimicrobiales bacterium]|nr:alkaline phosphatase family protein [Acidimicrobiales bacterium]